MTRFSIPLGLACASAIAGCGDRSTPPPVLKRVAEFEVPLDPRTTPTFEADVAPMIARLCGDCHDSSTHRGGIVLDETTVDAETWARVADALRGGTMPPASRPRPSPTELDALIAWLDADVFRCSEPDLGRVTMRRLNRAEYDNTMRDLFGLDIRLAGAFPADDVGYGFDKIGDVLSIPPILMEKYLDAADRTIEQAVRSREAWAKIMNPPPDSIPLVLRKPTFEARSEPVKRIGRPSPTPTVEDRGVLVLRRARDILRAFADRAYRRPATAEELTRLVGLFESASKDGDDFDESIRHALKAVLISPSFLFLVEEDQEAGGPSKGKVRPLGEFELASRLSYFLWSTLPDDELYQLAVRGQLRRDDNLARQVHRMLRDEKARALVDGFAEQWLQIRALRDLTPDPGQYPDFEEALRRSMLGETARFAGSIFLEDGRVFDFLDAEYTFVNQRLARHYGISGINGDHFRRVSLAGTGRSGILTQASVLTVTSNPTRTSPVKRGKWALDNLLAMPPPSPPDGVEGLKAEEAAGPPATLRKRMERHREDALCASCHARMDPIGFALENFDGIGAWRLVEEGVPIDASGTFPGGETFQGTSGLRDLLIARRDAFGRCLAEKLLTYALGRGVGPADRCSVDEIVRKLNRGGGRSSALIVAIVESPPFRNRQVSKEQP